MKLKYLRELLGFVHGQNYSCGECSCILPVDNDKNMEKVHLPFSKYNIPFDFVKINKGSIVVNIISHSGYEILKASEKTGANGKVIGIDFSAAMMYKARYNVEKNGCRNVFFREAFSTRFLPLGANISDALIFNNLLNCFPNDNLFSEIYRTLKPGGVFYIYDIISEYMSRIKSDVNSKADYIQKLNDYGFKNIIIRECIKDLPENNSDATNLNFALISGEK
jgi:ubiquinone/menaquinone biosynthesis C-methylase UbiE